MATLIVVFGVVHTQGPNTCMIRFFFLRSRRGRATPSPSSSINPLFPLLVMIDELHPAVPFWKRHTVGIVNGVEAGPADGNEQAFRLIHEHFGDQTIVQVISAPLSGDTPPAHHLLTIGQRLRAVPEDESAEYK